MAGDWIKMRLDLQTHPKVVRILSATKSDKFRVIGGLHAVWSVFDTHSSDGKLSGYTPEALDHIIGWQGFSQAMIDVGWLLLIDEVALLLPEFDEHNGASGKRRAEDTKRKRNERKSPKSVRSLSEEDADGLRTREEKRREEKEDTSSPSAKFNPLEELAKRGVSSQVAIDWLSMRKNMKAPVTATVIRIIISEAAKANLSLESALEIACRRSWRGFESSWLRAEDLAGITPTVKDWI